MKVRKNLPTERSSYPKGRKDERESALGKKGRLNFIGKCKALSKEGKMEAASCSQITKPKGKWQY